MRDIGPCPGPGLRAQPISSVSTTERRIPWGMGSGSDGASSAWPCSRCRRKPGPPCPWPRSGGALRGGHAHLARGRHRYHKARGADAVLVWRAVISTESASSVTLADTRPPRSRPTRAVSFSRSSSLSFHVALCLTLPRAARARARGLVRMTSRVETQARGAPRHCPFCNASTSPCSAVTRNKRASVSGVMEEPATSRPASPAAADDPADSAVASASTPATKARIMMVKRRDWRRCALVAHARGLASTLDGQRDPERGAAAHGASTWMVPLWSSMILAMHRQANAGVCLLRLGGEEGIEMRDRCSGSMPRPVSETRTRRRFSAGQGGFDGENPATSIAATAFCKSCRKAACSCRALPRTGGLASATPLDQVDLAVGKALHPDSLRVSSSRVATLRRRNPSPPCRCRQAQQVGNDALDAEGLARCPRPLRGGMLLRLQHRPVQAAPNPDGWSVGC